MSMDTSGNAQSVRGTSNSQGPVTWLRGNWELQEVMKEQWNIWRFLQP